jgi:hypothetical protein
VAQIKARLAGNGPSLVKSRNTELSHACCPECMNIYGLVSKSSPRISIVDASNAMDRITHF